MLFSVLFSQSISGELPAGQGNCWELPSELLNLYQHCRVSLMETRVCGDWSHIQMPVPLTNFRGNLPLLQELNPTWTCSDAFKRT